MKAHRMKILSFLLVLYFTNIAYSQHIIDPNKPKYDQENMVFVERPWSDSLQIEPHGDYSKLELLLSLSKKEYNRYDQIDSLFCLKNNTKEDELLLKFLNMRGANGVEQGLTLTITDEENIPVPKTLFGADAFPFVPPTSVTGVTYSVARLQPQKIANIRYFRTSLHRYFDLSLPGTYKVSASLREGSVWFNPTLTSDTIEFRILNAPFFTSQGLKSPGVWNNPAGDVLESNRVVTPEKSWDLAPSGEYVQLKYVLRSNKREYKEAEPVFVRLFIRNESEAAVNLCLDASAFWQDQRWFLTNEKDETMPKTRFGKRRIPETIKPAENVDWLLSEPSFVTLESGKELEIGPGEIQLDLYHDISMPGKYRLKTARSTLIPGQRFDPPLESNELTFEIVAGRYLEPEDLVEPGSFEMPTEKETVEAP